MFETALIQLLTRTRTRTRTPPVFESAAGGGDASERGRGGRSGEGEESADEDEDIFAPPSEGTGVHGTKGVENPATQSLHTMPRTESSLQLYRFGIVCHNLFHVCLFQT